MAGGLLQLAWLRAPPAPFPRSSCSPSRPPNGPRAQLPAASAHPTGFPPWTYDVFTELPKWWLAGKRIQSLCLEGLTRSRLTLCCFPQLEMELKVLQAQAGPSEQSVLLSREETSELRCVPPTRAPVPPPIQGHCLLQPLPCRQLLCTDGPWRPFPSFHCRWPASPCPWGSESWAPATVPGLSVASRALCLMRPPGQRACAPGSKDNCSQSSSPPARMPFPLRGGSPVRGHGHCPVLLAPFPAPSPPGPAARP